MNQVLDDVLQYNSEENEDFYAVLGCDELSSKEQIIAEYKARVLDCHPDKHPGDLEKARRFEQIQGAKDVLSDDEERQNYDKWRRSGIAVPYKRWCNMRDSVHTSMHWATPKKETMLEHGTVSSREPESLGHVTGQGHVTSAGHNAGSDLSFLRTGRDIGRDQDIKLTNWRRDPPSEMLRKFRNYEI